MTMKSDLEVKADLMERIDAIPAVNVADIEILVEGGLVTLNGAVDTHQTRFQVERTARRVPGIRGLKINIKPTNTGVKKGYR
ncbi:MAG: BON domain-containing protein [Burkholderiales bacterium]|nr:BON domain-containing protein [Burkholderiales bacterium]